MVLHSSCFRVFGTFQNRSDRGFGPRKPEADDLHRSVIFRRIRKLYLPVFRRPDLLEFVLDHPDLFARRQPADHSYRAGDGVAPE